MPREFTLKDKVAKVSIEDLSMTLPIAKATSGPNGILVSALRNDNFVTLDPGFLTTAQCESQITYIDGSNSILRYRGYPIEQLAKSSNFVETSYLLINGELPNKSEYENFCDELNHRTLIDEDFRGLLSSFPRRAHPMTILSSAVGAMAAYYPRTTNPLNRIHVKDATLNILAKSRTIISFIHRRLVDKPLLYPDHSRGYVDDFIRMCFSEPYEEFASNPIFVSALDRLLILHADHEQNCSTTAVRITGSANASLYSSISTGVNALSGPLHGGANESAIKQLREIYELSQNSNKSLRDTVIDFVERHKGAHSKLAGLGHRVYKSYDPRATIAKEWAKKIYDNNLGDLSLFDTALELERITQNDDYFLERSLYPNVDFWTGLVYNAMGFDRKMFTALFALGRMPGWISQWTEMHADPMSKIGRPRQVYIGKTERNFVEMSDRK